MDLTTSTVLATGANRGFGRALAADLLTSDLADIHLEMDTPP